MKCFGILACFLLVVWMALLGNTQADCNYKGRDLKDNEEFQLDNQCALYRCIGNDTVAAKGCPAEVAPPSCEPIPQDNTKSYPACCPSFDCS